MLDSYDTQTLVDFALDHAGVTTEDILSSAFDTDSGELTVEAIEQDGEDFVTRERVFQFNSDLEVELVETIVIPEEGESDDGLSEDRRGVVLGNSSVEQQRLLSGADSTRHSHSV